MDLVGKKKKKNKGLLAVAAGFGSSSEDDGAVAGSEKVARRTVNERLAKTNERNALAWDAAAEAAAQELVERGGPSAQKGTEDKVERKSKYIGQFLENAKERDKRRELAVERLKRKEVEEEEMELGPAKEVFVTKAYQRRLQERKEWEAKEKRQEEEEAKNDVREKGFGGFYSNMLDSRIESESAAVNVDQHPVESTLSATQQSRSAEDFSDIHAGQRASVQKISLVSSSTGKPTPLSDEYIEQAQARALQRAREKGIPDSTWKNLAKTM